MRDLQGDIWNYVGKVDVLCITTNLSFHGVSAVMGAGLALQAKQRYPGIEVELGQRLATGTYHPTKLWEDQGTEIWSFPTKPPGRRVTQWDIDTRVMSSKRKQYSDGDYVPSWAWKSEINFIVSSAVYVARALDADQTTIIGRPGCGLGELNYDRDVRPRLQSVWNEDRFSVITY